MKSPAVVNYSSTPHSVELREVSRPEIGADDVLLAVEAVGVCGSVPARCLHRVPAGLAMEIAALTEPCCVAFNAVINNARVLPGDRVVVLGPGPIGILCAAVARLAGAEVALVGLERDRVRLETAKAYGCEVIIGDATAWAKSR